MDIDLKLVSFQAMVFYNKKYFRNSGTRSRVSGGGSRMYLTYFKEMIRMMYLILTWPWTEVISGCLFWT